MNSYMRVSSAWIVLCAWDSRTPPLNVKGSRPSRLTFQRRPANARFQEKSRIMCGTANRYRAPYAAHIYPLIENGGSTDGIGMNSLLLVFSSCGSFFLFWFFVL